MNICSIRWKTPTSIVIAGPSGSGKTHFLRNLLEVKSQLFDPPPKTVIYFYKVYQEHYDYMKKLDPSIFFIDELPQTVDGFKSLVEPHKEQGSLVVFDDYEEEMLKNISLFTQVWTVLSHHLNVTPIAVLHNLFAREIRTISLNTHRLVLTKSLRDSAQISYLSRQCYPHVKNFLPAVYRYCMTLQDFPYLILNFTPGRESDNYIKVLTRIFKHEKPMLAFKEDQCYKGKGGNPYEKLVLLNQNLYNLLKRSGGYLQEREETERFQAESLRDPVSNINNIEVNTALNGNRSLNDGYSYERESEQIQGDATGDQKDSQQNHKLSSSSKDESGSRMPFQLPKIDEVFGKKHHLQHEAGTSIRSNEITTQQKTAKNNISFIPPAKKGFNKKVKRREKLAPSTHLQELQSSVREPMLLDHIPSSQNELDTTQRYNTASKQDNIKIKRKVKWKANSGVTPLKTRKINESAKRNNITIEKRKANQSNSSRKRLSGVSENSAIVKNLRGINNRANTASKAVLKKSMKRRAKPLVNREIHPFKALKYSKGDKRKREDDSSGVKLHKSNQSSFNVDPGGYQKWNF